MEFFAWFENTALSIWVRESPLVFPSILIAHALGMGTLAGINVLIGLRAIGVAKAVPPAMLERFVPLMWTGFIASLLSGLLLLAAYPAKALTNPVFYLKFVLIGGAFALSNAVRRRLSAPDAQMSVPLAWTSLQWAGAMLLLLWAAATTAGRFLAYTHSVLLASHLLP
jgi:hypothetical protein